jgi:outer membrane usher protein
MKPFSVGKRQKTTHRFCKIKLLFVIISGTHSAWAEDYFDPKLLDLNGGAASSVDLSQFKNPGSIAAGQYLVDIYINDNYWSTENVTFSAGKQGEVTPELTPAMLDKMGVNVKNLPEFKGLPVDKPVQDLQKIIPDASVNFDQSQLQLNISVPQIKMKGDTEEYINPALWQEGINAFLLNYTVAGDISKRNGNGAQTQENDNSVFASFSGGLNMGAWRLRSSASWEHSRQQTSQYDTAADSLRKAGTTEDRWTFLNTYLQRDIARLHSELNLGDISTGTVASQVFDGFSYRGLSLATNRAMIPDRLQGFAPTISGIAYSRARVVVRQNGNIIFQTYVPAGPFKFNNLSDSGNAGDLYVTITESDGTTHGFHQAYSSLPVMQREGSLTYEYDMGSYRQSGGLTKGSAEQLFSLVSLIYGLPHSMTLYGGALGAEKYQSAAVGLGSTLGHWGAVSADVTVSRTVLPRSDDPVTGSSLRVKYAKSLTATGTVVDLSAWRYSTRQFYNFQDANMAGYTLRSGLMPWILDRRRDSWQIGISQSLGEVGALSVSASRTNYWNSSRSDTALSAGFNSHWRGVSWGIAYGVDHVRGSGNWPLNRQVSFSMSVPFSAFMRNSTFSDVSAHFNMAHNSSGRVNSQLGLAGQLNDNASWYASRSEGNQGQITNTNVGGAYNGSVGDISLGYGYDNEGYRSLDYGLSGGMLIHRYGITLSQPIGDSAVLVRAAGAPGVRVMNGGNLYTNRWGYAVVSDASVYRRNAISLDPSSLPDGVDLAVTSQNVWPTQGAVVLADYPVRIGQQVLINLTYQGKPVPFGASVVLVSQDKQKIYSIVGDNGQVYLSGMPDTGSLNVSWGNRADAHCVADFSLGKPVSTKEKKAQYVPLKQVAAVCR